MVLTYNSENLWSENMVDYELKKFKGKILLMCQSNAKDIKEHTGIMTQKIQKLDDKIRQFEKNDKIRKEIVNQTRNHLGELQNFNKRMDEMYEEMENFVKKMREKTSKLETNNSKTDERVLFLGNQIKKAKEQSAEEKKILEKRIDGDYARVVEELQEIKTLIKDMERENIKWREGHLQTHEENKGILKRIFK
jgi:chromosome segregation ATPase